MKNIIILAHEFSKLDKEKVIKIKHIIMALDFVEIVDKKSKEFIYNYFEINPDLHIYPKLQLLPKELDADDETIFDKRATLFIGRARKVGCLDREISRFYNPEFPSFFDTLDEDILDTFLEDELESDFFINREEEVTENEGFELLKTAMEIKKNLSSKLFGQAQAIESISDSIKNNIVSGSSTPKQTYLFLGPPATGKTYLAELLSEYLSEYVVKRFDMTQYTHLDSGGYLYGTARFWGNAKPGSLTSFVKKHPKSIIILDEFEKADNAVQTNLLTIFEGGFLQDACGWCPNSKPWGAPGEKGKQLKCSETEIDDIVDFTQTIFVITSNLGKELYSDSKFIELLDQDYTQAESMILDVLKREKKRKGDNDSGEQAIVPELVSRFSQANIVLFNNLAYDAFELIADQAFNTYKDEFCKKFKVSFDVSSDYALFLKTQILLLAPELDARRVKSKIGINFFDKVTDFFMSFGEDMPKFSTVKIVVDKDVRDYLSENINTYIADNKLVHELFRKNLTLKVKQEFSYKNEVITCFIKSCSLERVLKVKDFGADGLVFDIPNISFNDIAGHKMAKMRLQETIRFLKNPKYLEEFKIDAPKGMLLYGVSGTGKTLLAKAFAHEANLPFIAVTGSDLLDLNRIEKIFKKAKEYAPSIVFIDEIDAIGSRENNTNREIFINQFISELDGFSSNIDETVFVIAATNYKSKIDSAILRPGRIELHIQINALDRDARRYFLQDILETKPVEGAFDMDILLMYTTGMTGAQLELIGKEASIYCIRKKFKKITQDILLEQINIVKYGAKIQHKNLASILDHTAIHEAGHAVLHRLLMPHIKIEQVTVVPREETLGFVSYDSEDVIVNLSIEDIKNKIVIAYAGRTAQIKKYGKDLGMDTGASSDLKQATHYAYLAITRYGMDNELGYINLEELLNYNKEYYTQKIDQALQRWLEDGRKSTEKLVAEHWEKIEKLAKLLIKKEVVFEEEMNETIF